MLSAKQATLVDLTTTLGSEDVYDILEVLVVDAHNDRVINASKD